MYSHSRSLLLLVSCLSLADLSASVHASTVRNNIDTILNQNKITRDDFSLTFQSVDQNIPLISINNTTKRHPASLIKIVTTSVVLELLGPNHRWQTLFFTDGREINNTLKGNLFIKGGGDPFLTIEDMWKIIYEFRKKGINHIDGNVFFDNTYFKNKKRHAKRIKTRLYEVEPDAFIANFKWTEFIIQVINNEIEILHFPPFKNLKIKNQIKVTNKTCVSKNIRLIFNTTENNEVFVSGEMPRLCGQYRLSRSILSPEDYFFSLFKYLWETTNDGEFPDSYSIKNVDPSLSMLLNWRSKSLAEIVKSTNKWSNNLMSKSLLLSLGNDIKTEKKSIALGRKSINRFLTQHALDSDTLELVDGSGLGKEASASTDDIVRVLNFSWKRNTMPEFVSSLSIAGEDGTTKNLFKDLDFENSVRVKTGTLSNVVSVGGYIFPNRGQKYSFAAIINTDSINKHSARNSLEQIIKELVDSF